MHPLPSQGDAASGGGKRRRADAGPLLGKAEEAEEELETAEPTVPAIEHRIPKQGCWFNWYDRRGKVIGPGDRLKEGTRQWRLVEWHIDAATSGTDARQQRTSHVRPHNTHARQDSSSRRRD